MDFDVNMQLEGVDFYSVAMLRENSFLLFVSCSGLLEFFFFKCTEFY